MIPYNGVVADAFNAVDCVLIQDGQMIAQEAGSSLIPNSPRQSIYNDVRAKSYYRS